MKTFHPAMKPCNLKRATQERKCAACANRQRSITTGRPVCVAFEDRPITSVARLREACGAAGKLFAARSNAHR